ncbi:hypothetical protein N7493_011255 [Penicillium malachiteum]|uniref:Uncharacterized protein n=1 Tax=Penicillium malachiteum TaxID=1324776 RepID=A0AAD6HBS6_9EURO|nr:hypothetical protein N7493_011255 [Penicillium malachiteum]
MEVTSILKDVALLLLYLGHQAQIPSFWIRVIRGVFALGVGIASLSIIILLVRVLSVPRTLVSLSDEKQDVIGKPLLFPVTFSHTRFIPVKDQFSNRFLCVGVPVGLRCRIGNLLAIDDSSLDVSPAPGSTGWSWRRTFSHLSCWWTLDSARHLHRGDHGVDLRQKLDNYLLALNEDPAQWPHAYLMGIPQFMGWSRSVVSWWHLYNEAKDLDAVILEINNSYWEKRNIFLRVNPTSDAPIKEIAALTEGNYLDSRGLVRSLDSAPRANYYKGIWSKYIFASPFEKVDGLVSNRMMDPLQPGAWKTNTSFSNMTTMEDSGEVRMATRLTCDGPPIDPTQMSCFDIIKFVWHWTVPGIMTTAFIVVKALKIRFSGAMPMNKKPPVRTGSVGRPITEEEIKLEPIFRSYLEKCIQASSEPVELTYMPCRSFTNDFIRMRSPSYKEASSNALSLTVEPADPGFYTRFITYPDIKTALDEETKPTGLNADPNSQRLLVSNPNLLASLCDSASHQKTDLSPKTTSWQTKLILLWCRGNSGPTFIDDFVLATSTSSRSTYLSSLLGWSSVKKLAFGSPKLFGLFTFFVSCLIRLFVWEGLSYGYRQTLSTLHVEPSIPTLVTISGYLFTMTLLGSMKNWFL